MAVKMKMKIKMFIIAQLLFNMSLFLCSETLLIVDFEKGLDASYSMGDAKAYLAKKIQVGDVSSVEGKFGKGVRIERGSPAYALHYNLPRGFSWKEGTVEFWFKPYWDAKNVKHVVLFASGNSPSGVAMSKYKNNLGFTFSKSYKSVASASSNLAMNKALKRDRWVYLACSWDENEGRIFADGKLLAVSDKWELPIDRIRQFRRFALGCNKYGKGRAAGGVFDELRISNKKRYVASFPVPEKPCGVEKKVPPKKQSAEKAEEKKSADSSIKASPTLFHLDFSDGLKPLRARGNPDARTNRELKFSRMGDQNYLKLSRHSEKTSDTLAYETQGNLNPFLGKLTIQIRIMKNMKLPVTLFESTHLSRLGLTGVSLLINSQRQLEWRALENSKVLNRLVSNEKIPLNKSDISLGFSWGNATIALYVNNAKVAEKKGVPLHSRLGRYFFIGSNCKGTNAFDGLIKSFEIF